MATPKTEQQSAINTNLATPKIPIVVNENARNKWGSARGYKVQVNRVIHELMPESEPWKKSLGEWRKGKGGVMEGGYPDKISGKGRGGGVQRVPG